MPTKVDSGSVHVEGQLAWLHAAADELLERPDPGLDDALNAAAASFLRHGLAHTSVRDIAAELGVSKATVYRQVGTVENALRALLARELHGLVDAVVAAVGDSTGPSSLLDLISAAAEHICDHPLVGKVIADEPHIVGEFLPYVSAFTRPIASVLTTVIEVVRPDQGAGSSSAVTAEVAVRVVLSAVIDPPPALLTMLSDALAPHIGI